MSDGSFKLTLQMDSARDMLIRRNLQKGGKVQVYIDSEVLRYSDPYVPKDTGKLINSGTDATVKGSGMVRYNTPYARQNYYSNRGRGKQGMNSPKGGLRGKMWFERMKADHKDDILRGVKKICGSK